MGKRNKGPARKHLHMAAEARKDRNRQLYFLLLAVLGGILVWGLISFTPINDHSIAGSVVIFGEVGVRFSRYNNEYNNIKDEYGITNQMIKDYLKSNK